MKIVVKILSICVLMTQVASSLKTSVSYGAYSNIVLNTLAGMSRVVSNCSFKFDGVGLVGRH